MIGVIKSIIPVFHGIRPTFKNRFKIDGFEKN